jgi:hypothetical protein
VLLTEATRCLLEQPVGELDPRRDVELKGKSEPVAAYALGFRLDERPVEEPPRLTAEA